MPATSPDLLFAAALQQFTQNYGDRERPAKITIRSATGLKLVLDIPAWWQPGRKLDPAVPTHSPDFRSVNWFGETYQFTGSQSAVVKVLWAAWESGSPDVGLATLLESVGSDSPRLLDIFRDNPAWGTMVQKGPGRGTYRLVDGLSTT